VQRALTILVVLCVAAGPGMNLDCLVRCAPMAAAAESSSTCHQPADSDLQVTSPVDCADHQVGPSPALISGRIVAARGCLIGPVATTVSQSLYTLHSVPDRPGLLVAWPPPSYSATPLRI
jgi:hypothetical protein